MKFLLVFFAFSEAYKCNQLFCHKCSIIRKSRGLPHLKAGCKYIKTCCFKKYDCYGSRICGLFRSETPDYGNDDETSVKISKKSEDEQFSSEKLLIEENKLSGNCRQKRKNRSNRRDKSKRQDKSRRSHNKSRKVA